MVRTDSIKFDVEAARKRAADKGWDLAEWARQADLSTRTLRDWLAGNPTIKIRTIDAIVRPLGLTAAELIRTNGHRINGKK